MSLRARSVSTDQHDPESNTPFVKLQGAQAVSGKKMRTVTRFYGTKLFCVGFVVALVVLAAVGFAGHKVLDKRGFEVKIVQKEVPPPPMDDEEEFDFEESDEDSEYTIPKQPFLDKEAGVNHPPLIGMQADEGKPLMVLGGGLRSKSVGPITVKVYSVAFYADPVEARTELSAFSSKSAASLRSTEDFYTAFSGASFTRCARLLIRYGVSRKQMVEGIADGLKPQLDLIAPSRSHELVEKFEALITEHSFNVNDVLLIGGVGDSLVVEVNKGEPRMVEAEPDLVTAFFSIYTNPNTAIPLARQHLVDRVPQLWQRSDSSHTTQSNTVEESASDDTITEHMTGQQFPTALTMTTQPSESSIEMSVAGVSGRAKSIIPFLYSKKIYAIGLYLLPSDWTSSVHPSDASSVLHNLLNTNSSFGMRVQMAMDVDSATVMGALADSLKSHITSRVDGDDDMVDQALCGLRNLLPFALSQGTTIHLHCSPERELMGVVGGVSRPAVGGVLGRALCEGIAEVYLGHGSVLGDEGKRELVSRVVAW